MDHLEAVLEAGARSLNARDKRLELHGVRGRVGGYALLADEELISLVGDGDAQAFATLHDRHSRAAYSLAYRMMGERQAAEDLSQDAFLKIWRNAKGYRTERGSVRSWVLSIVRNRGIDQLRSHTSRRRTQDKVEASAPTSEPSEAFAQTWHNFQLELLHRALEEIPYEQRNVLLLKHFSDLTHAEIAERLRLPVGTVKGRMRLGLEKLRKNLELRGIAVG